MTFATLWLVLSLAAASMEARGPTPLRCADQQMGLPQGDIDEIRLAISQRSTYPLVRIQTPDRKLHLPEGVLEARTLISGDCTDVGYGEWFRIRKAHHRWSVLKKSGRWYTDVLD